MCLSLGSFGFKIDRLLNYNNMHEKAVRLCPATAMNGGTTVAHDGILFSFKEGEMSTCSYMGKESRSAKRNKPTMRDKHWDSSSLRGC